MNAISGCYQPNPRDSHHCIETHATESRKFCEIFAVPILKLNFFEAEFFMRYLLISRARPAPVGIPVRTRVRIPDISCAYVESFTKV